MLEKKLLSCYDTYIKRKSLSSDKHGYRKSAGRARADDTPAPLKNFQKTGEKPVLVSPKYFQKSIKFASR
jgi:hypothetical protein